MESKPKRRRLSRAASLLDDEAEEVIVPNHPPVPSVVASFDSPQRAAPIDMSAFASRQSTSSPGSKYRVTMTVLNNSGVVRVAFENRIGSTFSEPINKIMRAAQAQNGS